MGPPASDSSTAPVHTETRAFCREHAGEEWCSKMSSPVSRPRPPTMRKWLAGRWIPDAVDDVRRRLERSGSYRPGDRRLRGRPERAVEALRFLISTGRWLPQPPREVAIPKKSGGVRMLSVYRAEDQAVHLALQRALSVWLEPRFEPTSWGFRPGRSVRGAAMRVRAALSVGFCWAADLDVRDCFGTIHHDLLIDALGDHGVDDDLLVQLVRRLLGAFCSMPSPRSVGIAQGSPLSPLLANVYLHHVDRDMRAYAGYLRYADDLVCLARTRREAAGAWERMRRALATVHQSPSLDKFPSRNGLSAASGLDSTPPPTRHRLGQDAPIGLRITKTGTTALGCPLNSPHRPRQHTPLPCVRGSRWLSPPRWTTTA